MSHRIQASWRKKGSIWYARYRHPITRERIERSSGCRTRTLAEEWLDREWMIMVKPETAPPPEVPLARAVAEYLAERERGMQAGVAGSDKPSTFLSRKKKMRVILRTLGADLQTHELTVAAVERFRDVRMAKISAHSVHKDLVELRQFCKFAVRVGYLTENPAADIDVAFKVKKVDRSITPLEFAKLYEALAEKRKLYALLMVETGARPGVEVESILWGGVDVAKLLVHIPGEKTDGSDRWVPIRPAFAQHLVNARGVAGDDEVIVERWQNAPRDFKKASQKAGIWPVRPYDLRHTYASWALQGGAPDTHVAKALGHASTTMVHRVYGHLRPDHLQTVTGALPGTPILPIQANNEEANTPEPPASQGPAAEKLAHYLPQKDVKRGRNGAKCEQCDAIRQETKNPAELSNPAGFNDNLEATTRIELVNGGFAVLASMGVKHLKRLRNLGLR